MKKFDTIYSNKFKSDLLNIKNKHKKYFRSVKKRVLEIEENPSKVELKKIKNKKDIFRNRIGKFRIFINLKFNCNQIIFLEIKLRKSNTYKN